MAATSQGVEIISEHETKYLLLCAPQVLFRTTRARKRTTEFRKYILNEIIIQSGYARYDPEHRYLIDKQQDLRLRAAEEFARNRQFGFWSSKDNPRDIEYNITNDYDVGIFYPYAGMYFEGIEEYVFYAKEREKKKNEENQ